MTIRRRCRNATVSASIQMTCSRSLAEASSASSRRTRSGSAMRYCASRVTVRLRPEGSRTRSMNSSGTRRMTKARGRAVVGERDRERPDRQAVQARSVGRAPARAASARAPASGDAVDGDPWVVALEHERRLVGHVARPDLLDRADAAACQRPRDPDRRKLDRGRQPPPRQRAHSRSSTARSTSPSGVSAGRRNRPAAPDSTTLSTSRVPNDATAAAALTASVAV